MQDIRSTGIGLDGVDGIWWRPALAPYQLPRSLHEQLLQAADAMFGLCDAAAIACDDDETARALVCRRLPRRIPRVFETAPVLCVRPDFQLVGIDASLLETHVLTLAMRAQLIDERERWVLKFAGFDRDERAWGGRSLQVGAQMTARAWRDTIDAWLRLPFPCVAQRAAPSALLSASDARGGPFLGRSRVRAFFVRAGSRVHVCGVHLTLARRRTNAVDVSEGADALQTPIVFA